MDKVHFKECSPEETVSKLKGILKDMDIETEELFDMKSSIGTFSKRVEFKGAGFGANGKGVSEVYCDASAYAELFERFQNDMMQQWKDCGSKKYGFRRCFDEKIMTAAEIVSEMNPYVKYFFSFRGLENASFEEKVKVFVTVNRLDYLLYGLENEYLTLPFYDVRSEQVVYLPVNAYSVNYGSNGMCAGNTYSEALVQGYSEIFERVAQRRIFMEKPTLPDVPDWYIKKFPLVDKLYADLKKDTRYTYYLKDCSFGGKYPVAALIVLEKDTGLFGVKLGCHPNYGIAMERCFTEAAQGRDIYAYRNSSSLDFYDTKVSDNFNITNSYKTGDAQWPFEIITGTPSYDFTPVEDVDSLSNEDLLKKWTQNIIDEGHDILIRDVSYLGFPSFHIIIPGLSELALANDKHYRACCTQWFISGLLAKPKNINNENIKYIIATFNYFLPSLMDNTVSVYYSYAKDFDFPAKEIGYDMCYMLAMCYAFRKNYSEASRIIYGVYSRAKKMNISDEKTKWYYAIFQYFRALSIVDSKDKALEMMKEFFSEAILHRLEVVFESSISIFETQYPTISDDCEVDDSYFEKLAQIRSKLYEKQVSSGILQSNLNQLFKEVSL